MQLLFWGKKITISYRSAQHYFPTNTLQFNTFSPPIFPLSEVCLHGQFCPKRSLVGRGALIDQLDALIEGRHLGLQAADLFSTGLSPKNIDIEYVLFVWREGSAWGGEGRRR